MVSYSDWSEWLDETGSRLSRGYQSTLDYEEPTESTINNTPLERANTSDWAPGGSKKAQEIWICAQHSGTSIRLTRDESKT
jgi:hypothetical protein